MRYCVDFQAGSYDWIGSGDETDAMGADQFTCARGWVVIQSNEFAGLAPSSESQTFTTEEIAALKAQALAGVPSGALSAEDGALLAWGVVLAWTAGWAARQIIRAFRGTSSTPGDPS